MEENRFLQVGPAGSATTTEAQCSQLACSSSTHRETCLKLAIAGFLDIRLSFKMRVKDLRKTLGLGWISYLYALSSNSLLSSRRLLRSTASCRAEETSRN